MLSVSNIPAYILAGGKSTRFGSDKTRVIVDGQALVQRVAAALTPAVGGITVIGQHAEAFADLGLRTIADRQFNCGPLGGLDAALADRGQGWLLLVSCDFVHIRAEWVQTLATQLSEQYSAIAFRAQFWEPLFALYHTSLSVEVNQRLIRNHFAMWKLLDTINSRPVPLPADWPALAHVNTPLELAKTLSQHPPAKESNNG